jgi:RNA polymerase sigma-70 factor, ECF subfamily
MGVIGVATSRPPMAMTRSDEGGGLAARRLAFERFTEQRLLKAYRLATVILRDPTDGEDAVHDAAVIAWTRFHELRDGTRFDAWFDRIVINVCRERLRRQRARVVVTQIVMEDTPSVAHGDGTSARAERDALQRALERLTPEHRLVVVLRQLEGYSTAEIAARTGEREGTVKSRLHYALRELRAAYDAAERGPEGER